MPGTYSFEEGVASFMGRRKQTLSGDVIQCYKQDGVSAFSICTPGSKANVWVRIDQIHLFYRERLFT